MPGGGHTSRVSEPVPVRTGGTALVGHTAPVRGVAFAGRLLASASADATVRLWDPETGQAAEVLTGRAPFLSLASNGATLAAGDAEGTIFLWTPGAGEVTELTATGRVHSLAFSPDGTRLASSSAGEAGITDRMWPGGEVRATRPDRCGHALAFHPDGELLATSGGFDGTVHLLGAGRTLHGHSAGINAAQFSPDGATLATGSTDATIRLRDVATWTTTRTLEPRGHYVQALAFSADGTTLATASIDPAVRFWNVHTGQQVAKLFGHTDYIHAMALSPDGAALATGSEDHTVRLWAWDPAPAATLTIRAGTGPPRAR